MDLGDMMDKAKDALEDVTDEQIEQAADLAKEHLDVDDSVIDKIADEAQKLNKDD